MRNGEQGIVKSQGVNGRVLGDIMEQQTTVQFGQDHSDEDHYGEIHFIAQVHDHSNEGPKVLQIESPIESGLGNEDATGRHNDDEQKQGEGHFINTAGMMRSLSMAQQPHLESTTVNGSYHFTLSGYSLAKGMGVGKHIASGTFAVGGHEWSIYFYPDGQTGDHHHHHHREEEDESHKTHLHHQHHDRHDGHAAVAPVCVSVFIVLVSENSFDVKALFELSLLDRSGQGKHKTHSHWKTGTAGSKTPRLPYTLKKRGSMWGFRHFYNRVRLEASNFLKDDTIEFEGKVGVLLSPAKSMKLYATPASPLSPQVMISQAQHRMAETSKQQ